MNICKHQHLEFIDVFIFWGQIVEVCHGAVIVRCPPPQPDRKPQRTKPFPQIVAVRMKPAA